nr:MAG TPA: hypothetical protein [Bacteriophage sp.]
MRFFFKILQKFLCCSHHITSLYHVNKIKNAGLSQCLHYKKQYTVIIRHNL